MSNVLGAFLTRRGPCLVMAPHRRMTDSEEPRANSTNMHTPAIGEGEGEGEGENEALATSAAAHVGRAHMHPGGALICVFCGRRPSG